ncbi:MAG: hypothetical protein ACPKQO_01075 [Nitrososphaeraceae archaeon]
MMPRNSCKDVCQRVEGIRKRIYSNRHNPLEYTRCNTCDICFPKNAVQSRYCPCCSSKLSANGFKKTTSGRKRKYLESIGAIKRY